MNKTNRTTGVIIATLSLLLLFMEGGIAAAPTEAATVNAQGETLNPERINPHAEAPRKRISQEKKKAAADARKKKQAEKAARKAGQQGQLNTTGQGAAQSGDSSGSMSK